MAERKRTLADKLLGRNRDADPADLAKLSNMVNEAHKSEWDELDWDYKSLASMSKIGQATAKGRGKQSGGTETKVSYQLLRDISLKSEVVNAILRRTVDDTLGNGYHFTLPAGKESGDEAQLVKIREWFKNPNPDDNGNEWLETLIYDLALFGDAYLELDGSEDSNLDGKGVKWTFGGELVSVWPIPAEQMKLTAGNRRPAPPAMAYCQELNGETREFSSDKVIHISKFKHGRAYGTSPLISLLNVIAGHLNLSNYLNELYTGTLPKTILNVGDISNAEMKAMLSLLEQQLTGGKSPFGLVAVNGGTGFNMHRVLDSTREGAQLDLLYYYREEICAVFGIPPMKLGWVQTGKMSNPEQQLDAWYDVIESFHRRIEAVINNRLLPILGITDWEFQFITIRPSREKEMAETRKAEATAIGTLRQEGVVSVNEARAMLGLERLTEPEADDPFYLSPKLAINAGAGNVGVGSETPPETPPSLSELFPPAEAPSDEGKGAGSIPDWVDEIHQPELSDDIRLDIASRRIKATDEFDELISKSTIALASELNAEQQTFADDVIRELNQMFSDGDEAVEIPDVDLDIPVKMFRRKDTISISDIELAVGRIDSNIADTIERQIVQAEILLTDTYGATLATTLAPTGLASALMADDVAAIAFWRRRWVLPALRNTLGSHRANIIGVFEGMVSNGESWKWAQGQMKDLIDPNGSKYPAYFYERIARTETRRVVENSHLAGMRRAGFKYVERLVVVDDRTDRDLCAPYEGAKYRIEESKGVVPAHPNCRCTFVAVDDEPPEDEIVPAEEVLVPVIEFNNKAVSAAVRDGLATKAKEHNEKVKNAKTKKTSTRTLIAVFERGVGAYNTNPSSVRPSVSSPEQWAYARVNSFLYCLRNGRFRSGKHDTDLLPKGHPQSTKSALESKRALTTSDRTPPAGVRKACQTGIKLFEDGYGGSGLEAATLREARSIARGTAITVAKAKKMIRWWGRNERFLDEPKDSPAWTAAMLWGGRAGLSWSGKLSRALEAEE